MRPPGVRTLFWAAWAAALGSSGAFAAGLSAEQSGTVLGQPLNFPVQVRLDAGESLTADCVVAEVYVSDQRLPPGAVRTQIEQQSNGQARVRVQTQQAIDEPVVSISLRVGCAAPVTRRFVVFADPPLNAAPPAPPLMSVPSAAPLGAGTAGGEASRTGSPLVDSARPADAGRVARSTDGSPAASTIAANSESARAAARDAARDTAPGARRPAGRGDQQADASGRAARSTPSTPAKPAARTPARNNPERAPAVAAAGAAAPAPRGGPRLSLEPVAPVMVKPAEAASPSGSARAETDPVGQALQAVAEAASAARTAAAAASASADRMASLERTVAQLRSESQSNQALIAELRQKLDQAPRGSTWMSPLLAVAAALAALSAWLAWRLGRVQNLRQQAWMQQRQAGAVSGLHSTGQGVDSVVGLQSRARTGLAPFLSTDVPTVPPRSGLGSAPASGAVPKADTREFPTQPLPTPRPATSAATPQAADRAPIDLPDITPLDTPMARTEPMPGPLRGGSQGVRDVSIEELIDLEQQAEFFVVLGQDEAAIDLLVDHLRSTGGGSPLPYLKLLEIYSRTNDRSAYERNRARFNHRFNAYAPEWGSDLAHGRTLEDYPGILPRLEQVWPRPLDAMAELEALLFRKSRGELFELPAYREVLFLYALARDLLDHEAVETGSVDLLLPLSDGSSFGATAPIPFLHDETQMGNSRYDPEDPDDPPTRPVDFDLTIPAQQTSMFDPLDDAPHLAPLRRR